MKWIGGKTGMVVAAACCLLATALPANADIDAAPRNVLKPLMFFVGDWSCAGEFSNGKTISSHESFALALDGRWLRMRHVDDPPHRYKAVELWHYDPATKRFSIYVFDNSGGERQYAASGWNGDELVLQNVATHGYIDRFVFQRRSDKQYRVVYAHKIASGEWETGDTLDCTRIRE